MHRKSRIADLSFAHGRWDPVTVEMVLERAFSEGIRYSPEDFTEEAVWMSFLASLPSQGKAKSWVFFNDAPWLIRVNFPLQYRVRDVVDTLKRLGSEFISKRSPTDSIIPSDNEVIGYFRELGSDFVLIAVVKTMTGMFEGPEAVIIRSLDDYHKIGQQIRKGSWKLVCIASVHILHLEEQKLLNRRDLVNHTNIFWRLLDKVLNTYK